MSKEQQADQSMSQEQSQTKCPEKEETFIAKEKRAVRELYKAQAPNLPLWKICEEKARQYDWSQCLRILEGTKIKPEDLDRLHSIAPAITDSWIDCLRVLAGGVLYAELAHDLGKSDLLWPLFPKP